MMEIRLAGFADEAAQTLAGQMAALKRNGCDFLEIRNLDGKSFTTLTVQQAKEVALVLADHGLSVQSLGSPIGKIPIEGDFDAHMELYKHTLELGNVLGAGKIRLFSFFMPKGQDPSAYKEPVLERMGIMARTAKAFGIQACHENEKGIYGDTAARCLALHKAVPELRAVFDPANFVQSGQDTLAAWELLAPYVEYLHIKDALPDGQVVAPGAGAGNVPAIIKKYIAQGGRLLSLEPHLYEFVGLKSLEQENDASVVGAMQFSTADAAFDFAAEELKNILEGM